MKIRKRVAQMFGAERKPVLRPVYWPRDFLPKTVPFSRILVFGYDTRIRHRIFGPEACHNTVRDIANNLLVSLDGKRRVNSKRPLLFIVHSLGGIIVNEMLLQSRLMSASPTERLSERQQDLLKVSKAIRALIFFGTPQHGSDPRGSLQHIAESLIKLVGFKANESIVNALNPTSERFKDYRTVIPEMAQENGWMIYSFQESYGIKVLNGRKA